LFTGGRDESGRWGYGAGAAVGRREKRGSGESVLWGQKLVVMVA
jgi:hypothetical protein